MYPVRIVRIARCHPPRCQRTTRNRLLLADRGYPSVPYFEAVRERGELHRVRLTRSYDPWVRTAWVNGRRVDLSTRRRLSRFLTQYPARRLDLDVEFDRGHRVVGFRVVVLPGRD